MRLVPKNKMRLLPLTLSPQNAPSVLDWRPFKGGRSLGRLIDDHNDRCIRAYQNRGWLDEFIEAVTESIDVVLYDLSTVGRLHSNEYADIKILLVDLDLIDKIMVEIDNIKVRMGTHLHEYFLAQISQKPDTNSHANNFRPLPVTASDPEVLSTEAEFEDFLARFCHFYKTALNGTPPPPPPRNNSLEEKRSIQAYLEAIPKIASGVRDAAIARGLTEEETIVLAHRASLQELTFSRLAEDLHRSVGARILLDPVRELTRNISVEPILTGNPMEEVNLVRLKLIRPLRDLKAEQRSTVVDLGIKGKGYAAVHFDEPVFWDRVKNLRGVVKATRFKTELPRWSTRAGLNLAKE